MEPTGIEPVTSCLQSRGAHVKPVNMGASHGPEWRYHWQNWLVRYSERYSRVSGTHVVLSVIDGDLRVAKAAVNRRARS